MGLTVTFSPPSFSLHNYFASCRECQGYSACSAIAHALHSLDPPSCTLSLHCAFSRFIASIVQGVRTQIVSLGAGSDTLFWRLAESKALPDTYVEVDFEQVTSHKCGVIRRRSVLSQALQTCMCGSLVAPCLVRFSPAILLYAGSDC